MSISSFPILKPYPRATLETILPRQLYILDLLPPAQCERLLEWCRAQDLEGPKPAKKGEAERTSRRASQESPEIAAELLYLLIPHIRALDPCPPEPLLATNIRVYHYPPGTYFRGHYDSPQLDPSTRRLSCWTVLFYLGECTGGGTSFYPHGSSSSSSRKKGKTQNGGGGGKSKGGGKDSKDTGSANGKITMEAKPGRVLFHWHGVAEGGCMLHEGDEVLTGDKWVLRTDVLW